MTSPVLHASSLAYGTPDGCLLQKEIDFTVRPGEALLVSGSNGCGKSTLLKVLLGDWEAAAGRLDVTVPREKIEYLPQLENTEVHFPFTLGDVLKISGDADVPWEVVERFGLLRPSHLEAAWNSASGGERKRTLLTRAFLRDPQLLVLDEPMNHLDDDSRRSVARSLAGFLARSTQDAPKAIVMVCHQGLPEEERGLFSLVPLALEARGTA